MFDFSGISLSAAKALSRSIQPIRGGEIVEELVTLETANEPSYTYRWSLGHVIELCHDGAFIWWLGEAPTAALLIDIELIARAGDEWPDAFTIDQQRQLDEDRRLNAAEVDRLFDVEFSKVIPRLPANMNGVAP